jgi:2-polyprenyl-3-methyl-5-hydroxy-6-metoxy-1,4-benzoquinol methylase
MGKKYHSTTSCPICSRSTVRIVRDFLEDGVGSTNLMYCEFCNSEFLDPIPSAEIVAAQYENYFERRGREWRDHKRPYFRTLIDMISQYLSPLSVLEIGAGEGIFAEEFLLRYPSSQMVAIEPYNYELTSSARFDVVRETIEEWSNKNNNMKFELIVGLDLIEHISDPSALLERLVSQHLAPGGFLMFSTPNVKSLSKKILGRYWPHYKLEHLWYASPLTFNIFEKRFGLIRKRLQGNVKVLPIGYILQILSEFGPKVVKYFFYNIKYFFPKSLKNTSFSLPAGELIWIAKNDSSVDANPV